MSDLNNEEQIGSFDFIQKSFSTQVLSIALPSFYKKTGLVAKIAYDFIPDAQSVQIDFYFSPRVPTEAEYNMLLDDIQISEKLIVANTFLSHCEDISEIEELTQLKERLQREAKTSGIFLDIPLEQKDDSI